MAKQIYREPTDEMVKAGLYHSSADTTYGDVWTMWQAMWDRAVDPVSETIADKDLSFLDSAVMIGSGDRLQILRDAKDDWMNRAEKAEEHGRGMSMDLDAARKKIEDLQKALRPFASLSATYGVSGCPGNTWYNAVMAARAALL